MRIGIILIAGSMLLAACSSTSQLNPNQIEYYQSQQVSWESCPQDYFLKKDRRFENFNPANTVCTELEVPISYLDLSLGSKTIVMMGMGNANNPVVFYNPGGPGASGIEAVQTIDFPVVLDRDYFIVGFDPRGVGRSTPVRCDDEADLESYYKYDLYIESAAEAAEAEAGYLKFIKECAESNPNWWSVNTLNTVKDIELMRVVLTGKPLNFIGSSYGTTLAMEYIRAYPKNIGKVMLDSPVLIGLDNDEDILQQAKGFNDAFERLFAKCAADEKCPGTTTMGVIELFKEKLIEADAGKVLGYWGVQQFPTDPNSTVGSANLILDGLYQMSYFEIDQIYAEFRRGLKDLLEKNDSWIFEFYGLVFHGYDPETKERSNMDEILYIVNCMDIDAREFKTESELKEFDRKYAQVAPIVDYLYEAPNGFTWTPQRQGCEWSWLAFEDDSIPNPPAKVASPVNNSGKEILIIASTGDNATPYVGAVKVAKQLKSPLITFEGTGHAIAFNGNSCITEQITNFFSSAAPLASKTCVGN
jgi:pimeloyl-ACP methyl ester carboxylesterase